MSDLFQEVVPAEYISAVGRTMEQAHWHTFQILTKRHERMWELLGGELRWMARLENAWFGVSVENRRHGLPRVASLREAPASVRLLSVEPLLEDLGRLDLRGIQWVIVGGESGSPLVASWRCSRISAVRARSSQWREISRRSRTPCSARRARSRKHRRGDEVLP